MLSSANSIHERRVILTLATALSILVIMVCVPAQSQSYQVLYNFNTTDGAHPQAGVTFDRAGDIYGTTTAGGSGHGVVYELTPKGVLTPVYVFAGGSQGGAPVARVVFGPDGALYGTASNIVFRLRPRPTPCPAIYCLWNETTLYSKLDRPGTGDLIWDQAGNIYGAQSSTGNCYYGCVYELSQGSSKYQELYDFTGGDDGETPNDVTFDSAGNLYGTANYGGQYGYGTVFQLMPGGPPWTETTLHSFTDGADGAYPVGLTIDSTGDLWGANSTDGGDNLNPGMGTAFSVVPPYYFQGDFTTIYTFPCNKDCSEGGGPARGLTRDSNGNLYGTQLYDGPNNHGHGSVFELHYVGSGLWDYISLYEFCAPEHRPCPDGDTPYSTVTIGSDGNLYGTTNYGGTDASCGSLGCGVVWKISLDSSRRD